MSALLVVQLLLAGAGGTIIGSFLSVLVSRIPAMINAHEDGQPGYSAVLSGISWPTSHCEACHTPVRWNDNIPVLSYAILGGCCRTCGNHFGARYLMLELSAAIGAAVCVLALGWTLEALVSFILVAALLALTFIDLEEQLLPDVIVAPLLPLGLIFHHVFREGVMSAVMGALAAYCVMASIALLYRYSKGLDGMGWGDVKLAAVLGAWLGLSSVPFFLVGAFALGLFITVPMLALGKFTRQTPLPFGPFLAASALVFLLIPALLPNLQAVLFR